MLASQPPLKGFESLISGTHEHRRGSPILLLLHGWLESRFMWWYVVPALAAWGYTLFVLDLPGYGFSMVSTGLALKHDRHDRGARVSQRLATTTTTGSPPATTILGAMLLDIVPYSARWASHGANPRAATAYFHWAFLPCADLSTPMIKAFGGGAFCRAIMERGVGSNTAGRSRVYSDGAVDHYAALYERDPVIEGAVADYGAGVAEDWDEEVRDRELGRRIGVPTYVVYSERNLGRMHGDVKKIWREWVFEDVAFEAHGVGNSIGHYLPEEAPEEINAHIFRFLESLGV
ncbi:Alpha/Beta hydrolase protein [Biscogniauxia sp. FL1348]|nr:Alpha/Beta hydrolase protein [Biscogniauxia sp. FL1348]